jgi:glycosyltransferase involved in cell wall biosynthesis
MGLPSISILTATYNAQGQLFGLIDSLRAQTDADFEWVVADGASSDGTLDILNQARDLNPIVSSCRDFGIYDALNRALDHATGDYYLVLGADDRPSIDAVERLRHEAAVTRADFVTAEVRAGEHVLRTREGQVWRYGLNGLISAHSVGTLIRRSLHERHGRYSRRFPIAADQLFVTQACAAGASRHVVHGFIAGDFGLGGVSSRDAIGTATEFFRVQLLTGGNWLIQLALLCARILKAIR